MLKYVERMKEVEARAEEAVQAALAAVPAIEGVDITPEGSGPDRGIDFLVRFRAHGQFWTLACEVKSNGQPRFIRNAILQLRDYGDHAGQHTILVLIAPYLSEEARAMCREREVNYLDLEGNCRIVFDGIYIERETGSRPPSEKRELRSLFKPKSAQVLRVLLKEPQRGWKVVDLAHESNVSLGHITNVTTALLDREWASREESGFRLTDPDALLDNWRDNYEPPAGEVKRFYTVLHGKTFDKAARELMAHAPREVVLASYSAAQWLSPYGRSPSQYIYTTRAQLPALRNLLRAENAAKGDNLVVTVLEEDGIRRDAIEPRLGVFTTGLAQTYLDLANSGERGREAADHLREERLSWRN